MKRWWRLFIVAIIAATSATIIRSHMKLVAAKKRQSAYQLALQKYSQDLKLGSRRTEVESYLRLARADFSAMHTGFAGKQEGQWADLVKIGEEDAPWFCSEQYIYVAFEFLAVEKHKQNDSDLLEKIEIYPLDWGCL